MSHRESFYRESNVLIAKIKSMKSQLLLPNLTKYKKHYLEDEINELEIYELPRILERETSTEALFSINEYLWKKKSRSCVW